MFNNIGNPLAGYRAFGRPVTRKVHSIKWIFLGFIKGNTMQKEKAIDHYFQNIKNNRSQIEYQTVSWQKLSD